MSQYHLSSLQRYSGLQLTISDKTFGYPLLHGYNRLLASGRNYDLPLVMTDQISNLTEQSFPEICMNDQSLNGTIWTLKCNKLYVFDMVDELKRKSLLTEYYLCMQQNFMKQKFIHFACVNY